MNVYSSPNSPLDLCSKFCKNKTGDFVQFLVTKYSIMSFPLTLRIFLLPPDSNYYLPSVLILRVTCLRSSVISRSKKRYYFDRPQLAHSYSQYYFNLFKDCCIYTSVVYLSTLQQIYVKGKQQYIAYICIRVSVLTIYLFSCWCYRVLAKRDPFFLSSVMHLTFVSVSAES